jgi:predicted anti-sigma-YlaC factor YlaD
MCRLRSFGTLEVPEAVGLILPAVPSIAAGLVPVTAACVAVLVGAVAVEVREGADAAEILIPLVTVGLALSVAISRAMIVRF